MRKASHCGSKQQ